MDDEQRSAWQRAHDRSIAEADQEIERQGRGWGNSEIYIREAILVLGLTGGSIAMIVRGNLLLISIGVVTLTATVLGVLGLILNRRQ